MALSHDLLSQFAKLVTNNKKSSESTVYGTIVTDSKGNKYVKLDGSDQLTPLSEDERPVADSSTTNCSEGDRVSVLIKNHTATVTGNVSSPSVTSGDVQHFDDQISQIQEFDVLIGEQLQAQEGYIKKLQVDKASVEQLEAAKAEISELVADEISAEVIEAVKADITDLVADKIDADVVHATFATIESLNATNAEVTNLKATNVDITGKLTAAEADIDNLEVSKLSAKDIEGKYANIDFSNIGEAAIRELFSEWGLIRDLIVSNGTITGELVGVTIKGDLIEGGTVVADKLVVKGSDGLYYKLNTDGVSVETEQTEYNSLNGSVITAKSITATKIAVDDLVAFDATIGGFKITEKSIYSGVKESVDNTTRGSYLDNEGQLAFGDATNYLKYYKTEDGSYKLEIATGGKTIDKQINEVNFGGRNLAIGTSDEWTEFTHRDNAHAFEFTIGNITDDKHDISEFAVKSGDYLSIGIDLKAINKPIRLRVDYARTTDGDPSSTLISYKDYYGEYVQVNEEGRSTITIPIDDNSAYIYASIASDGSVSETTTEQYKCFQVEKSSKPTDWKPAPEDIKASIEDSETRTNTTISDQYTSLVNTCEGLVYNATQTLITESEFAEYKTEQKATIEATANSFDLKFDETSDTIASVDEEFHKFRETFSKYIKFTSDTAITIGSGDSAITLEIDNETGIIFKKNGNQFGWWDGVDFHTGNIVVEVNERAQFGNFAFNPRSDGSLMFLKVGG